MVIEPTGALDLWTLFVQYSFGGFWMAVIGLGLLLFIIMAVLGRMSIITVSYILLMFLLAMTLGYGFVTLNILITAFLIIAFIYSWKSWVDSR